MQLMLPSSQPDYLLCRGFLDTDWSGGSRRRRREHCWRRSWWRGWWCYRSKTEEEPGRRGKDFIGAQHCALIPNFLCLGLSWEGKLPLKQNAEKTQTPLGRRQASLCFVLICFDYNGGKTVSEDGGW